MFWVDNSSQRISKVHWKTRMCGFMYAYDKGTHTSVRTGEGLIMKEDVYRETRQLSWRVKGVKTYTTTTLRGSEKEWKGCSTLQEYVSREGVSVCVCSGCGMRVRVCVFVFECVCLYLFYVCLWFFLSERVCLCLYLRMHGCLYMSMCLLYVCLCFYLYVCVCLCLWVCMDMCMSVCVCVHVSVYVCT